MGNPKYGFPFSLRTDFRIFSRHITVFVRNGLFCAKNVSSDCLRSTSVGSYPVLSSPPCLKKPQYTDVTPQLAPIVDLELDKLTSSLDLQDESYHIAEASSALFDYEVVLTCMILV